jgi:hypothetical protein
MRVARHDGGEQLGRDYGSTICVMIDEWLSAGTGRAQQSERRGDTHVVDYYCICVDRTEAVRQSVSQNYSGRHWVRRLSDGTVSNMTRRRRVCALGKREWKQRARRGSGERFGQGVWRGLAEEGRVMGVVVLEWVSECLCTAGCL